MKDIDRKDLEVNGSLKHHPDCSDPEGMHMLRTWPEPRPGENPLICPRPGMPLSSNPDLDEERAAELAKLNSLSTPSPYDVPVSEGGPVYPVIPPLPFEVGTLADREPLDPNGNPWPPLAGTVTRSHVLSLIERYLEGGVLPPGARVEVNADDPSQVDVYIPVTTLPLSKLSGFRRK